MDTIDFKSAADCLKILAHPQRLQIIELLSKHKLSVGELAEKLNLQSHMTSEHLKLMQRCGFLKSQRVSRKIYYRIAEQHLLELLKCMRKKFKK